MFLSFFYFLFSFLLSLSLSLSVFILFIFTFPCFSLHFFAPSFFALLTNQNCEMTSFD